MELNYIENGNYLLSNLTLENNETGTINKYGRMRLNYLKENKKAIYTELLMENKLTSHLISVSKISEERLNFLMESYTKNDKRLFEKSKELNQLEWVRLMNNYKNTAEEIIKSEIIFN